jgi:hypothetical protein
MAHRLHEPINIDDINLSYFCRRCKQQVRGIPLTNPQYHISEFDDDPWLVVRCPTRLCELSFVIYNRLNDRIFSVYPLPNSDPQDYHEAIPEKIREDLAESDRCFNANSYKAAVAMNRRAIQNMVLNKIEDKSIKNKDLYSQIDALFNEGLITKHLKDTAHEIRHFGNFGAHPQDDNLDKTTREDAEAVDRLTWDLMRTIYITPYETEKLKAKRQAK